MNNQSAEFEDPVKLLINEFQNENDDITQRAQEENKKCIEAKLRWIEYIDQYSQELISKVGVPCSKVDFENLFDWAFMNINTRCFGGHHNLPTGVSMAPLMDLVNHESYTEDVTMFTIPHKLSQDLVVLETSKYTSKKLWTQIYKEVGILEDSEDSDEMFEENQHDDDLPDKYHNYQPQTEIEAVTNKFKGLILGDYEPGRYEKLWDLNDDSISVGLKVQPNGIPQYANKEVFFSYGSTIVLARQLNSRKNQRQTGQIEQ